MSYLHSTPKPADSTQTGPDLNGLHHARLLLTGEAGVVALGFDPEAATLPYVSAVAAGQAGAALAAQAEMMGLPCWEADSLVMHIISCDPVPGEPIPPATYGVTGAWLVQQNLLERCDILDMYVMKDLPRRPACRN